MNIRQLSVGWRICDFKKGRDPERPNCKCRYFWRGETSRQAEAFDLSLRDRRATIRSRSMDSRSWQTHTWRQRSMSTTDQDKPIANWKGAILPRLSHLSALAINDRYGPRPTAGHHKDHDRQRQKKRHRP